MAGPALSIELDGPVSEAKLAKLRDLLADVSSHLETKRLGFFDLQVAPHRLGLTTVDRDGDRPILMVVSGPGFGDEAIFEAEHVDEPDPLPLIGFVPTHAIGVLAGCNGQVDHAITAALTAAVMDIVGGVAKLELDDRQVKTVRALHGFRAATTESWPTVYGSAEFLRAWAAHPDFRLMK
jgi:hypothetical protein